MKSVAKSTSWVRELKDKLEFRGLSVVETKNADGFGRLEIDTEASIEIIAEDAVSKDVFGNDLIAFTPHYLKLAVVDAIAKAKYAEIMAEVFKLGIKTDLHEGANIAAAEAAAVSAEIEFDIQFPTKGN